MSFYLTKVVVRTIMVKIMYNRSIPTAKNHLNFTLTAAGLMPRVSNNFIGNFDTVEVN